MTEKTAFVIPCYNEEENIEDLINSCKNVINKSNNAINFILVNNGSKDSTESQLKLAMSPQIHFVNINKNIGMGNGIKKGLEYAIQLKNYQYYGWTHADLQIPQSSLIEALEIMKSERISKQKIYIRGRRRNRNNFDVVFTFFMACYTSLIKKGVYYDITGLPVLIDNTLINNVLTGAPNGFAFDVFTYIKAKRENAKVIRFNVDFSARTKGKSSWNTGIVSKIKMGNYYIKEIWKI